MEAMNYSVTAGGKRLRPLSDAGNLSDVRRRRAGKWSRSWPMEMIHTYSLVHDDLPAMDNDEYRRGKLTTHAKFGTCHGCAGRCT